MKRARADSHHHKIKEVTDRIKEIIIIPIGINQNLITRIKTTIIQEELETLNTTIKEISTNQKKKTNNIFRNITHKKMNTTPKAETKTTTINITKAASQSKKVNK